MDKITIHVRQPPLGVEPHWIAYQQRIEELSCAIQRYIEYARKEIEEPTNVRLSEIYEILANWASDLHSICSTEAELLRDDEAKRDSKIIKTLIKKEKNL